MPVTPHAISFLDQIVHKFGAIGCTAFQIGTKKNRLIGKNFDFIMEYGHIIINKRGIHKTNLVPEHQKPYSWISKYGSLTFNQLGREFPYGGMNEKGLVLEQLWYSGTQYPSDSNKCQMAVLQWIQFQLDSAQSIEEIIQSYETLQIDPESTASLHFFASDASGKCASLEFIEKQLVVQYISDYAVLTNHSYQASLDYVFHEKLEKISANIFTGGSLERFKLTLEKVHTYKEKHVTEKDAFEILDLVNQEEYTQWSQVYDPTHKKIFFKTFSNTKISFIDFNSINFNSDSPVLYHDLEDSSEGLIELKPYSKDANRVLNDKVCDILGFYSDLPEDTKEKTSQFPNTTYPVN